MRWGLGGERVCLFEVGEGMKGGEGGVGWE